MKPSILMFDLGVVIIDIDNLRAFEQIVKAGAKPSATLFSRENAHCIAYETGKISAQDFLKATQQSLENSLDLAHIESAWRSVIVDIPEWKINFLKQLKKQYRLIVLSNTNDLHVDEIEKIYSQKNSGKFTDLFDEVYFSHEVGYFKPQPEIYEAVLAAEKIPAPEILFFDDLEANIDAAHAQGFQTFHVTSDEGLKRKLMEL